MAPSKQAAILLQADEKNPALIWIKTSTSSRLSASKKMMILLARCLDFNFSLAVGGYPHGMVDDKEPDGFSKEVRRIPSLGSSAAVLVDFAQK